MANRIISPQDLARLSRALPFWMSLLLIPLAWFCAMQGGWTIALLPLVTWYLFSMLDAVLGLPGRFIELGRTCIHPHYRSGATLAVLWQGVAQLFSHTRGDYLIGCGSIPLACGVGAIHAMIANITPDRRLPHELAVATRHPLPAPDGTIVPPLPLPPLLRTYLRVGARVSNQAYWDRDFDCADLFVLLPRQQLANRYARHFSIAA